MKAAQIRKNPQWQVKPATMADVDGIHQLLDYYARRADLLPRPLNNISRQIQQFSVVRDNEAVIACASLEMFTRNLAEVRSLAVAENYHGDGMGKMLVTHLIDSARALGLQRLMALTYIPDFFRRLGFQVVEKSIFPEKVWGVCIHCPKHSQCDEIAVLLNL